MIGPDSTLADVCFAVAESLRAAGLTAVLTGGSAATLYAPASYQSFDADFVLDVEAPLRVVAAALEPLGFHRSGRIFAHRKSHYTVDFPRGPLAVGGDYVRETVEIESGGRRLRILSRTDCVRDRLAHYYHWEDFTALNAAVAVAASDPATVDRRSLIDWTERESPAFLEKFAEFERRLAACGAALSHGNGFP